jgi:hypothetical protein
LWHIDAIPLEVDRLLGALAGEKAFVRDDQRLNQRQPPFSFYFRTYAAPGLLLLLWTASGVFSGFYLSLNLYLLLVHILFLFFMMFGFAWYYLKIHGYVFCFFFDNNPVSEEHLGAYLKKIDASSGRTRSGLKIWFAKKCKNKVYIRSSRYSHTLPPAIGEKIFLVAGTAIHFNQITQAQLDNDTYFLYKKLASQRLPEIGVAICSFWALSLGCYSVFGSALIWSFLVLTLSWYFWRLMALMKGIRVWGPLLPFLEIHAVFHEMRFVSPDPLSFWRQKDLPDAVQHSNIVVGKYSQAIVGVYLFLFTQMVVWTRTGPFWPDKEGAVNLFSLFSLFING